MVFAVLYNSSTRLKMERKKRLDSSKTAIMKTTIYFLTYNLCLCNSSLYWSLRTLRHKAFSAICEKRTIFVFTLLMNTNGTVFCSYRTKHRWREFPISEYSYFSLLDRITRQEVKRAIRFACFHSTWTLKGGIEHYIRANSDYQLVVGGIACQTVTKNCACKQFRVSKMFLAGCNPPFVPCKRFREIKNSSL